MNKQICFVGFADSELVRLQPALETLGGRWDCVHFRHPEAALQAMRLNHFDVTVANLSPDGLHDPSFLQKAADTYPKMVRLVLGDVADREMIVGCMGAAHQFISKPWKPAELIAIIERSLALDSWLANDNLRMFIPRLGTLPGVPSTYFEVVKRVESPNSSVEAIAEVIARDPALTARLLQMVNSPACGLAEKVTSAHNAVAMLGMDTVKSLVLCLQLFSQKSSSSESGLSLEQLWKHSFQVAKLSAKVILRCINSEKMAGEAYTAGLLHNIGQIVLATNLSEEYGATVKYARDNRVLIQEAEMKLLGVTSNQVGAYLLGLWGMPLAMLESTALHLSPSTVSPPEFSLLTAVHVANVMAWEDDPGGLDVRLPQLDIDYLGQMDLPKKTDAWKKFLAAAPFQEKIVESRPVAPVKPEKAKPKKEPDPHAKSQKGKLVFLVVLLLVIGGCLALRHYNMTHQAQPVADNPSPGSNNQVILPTPVHAAEPEPAEFSDINLQGIFYKHNGQPPAALINKRTVYAGDMVGTVKVVSILPTSVIMECKGAKKTFVLPK